MLIRQDVDTLARLAQLALSDNSANAHLQALNQTISLLAPINAIETGDSQPLVNPLKQTQRLRVDEITESDQRERYQALAPSTQDGLYLVPKVLD